MASGPQLNLKRTLDGETKAVEDVPEPDVKELISSSESNSTDDGVPLVPFGQGFVSMSSPTKQLEVLTRTGKIWHDGDPVLRWALGNVELKLDPAGNIKADKQKSGGKIDPIVAMIMGIGEHMKTPQETEQNFDIISLS